MKRIHRVVVWMATKGAIAGGGLIVIAALVVTAEVLLRLIMGVSMSGADEISGYLFAVGTAWSFPYVIVVRANVRVDVLYVHMRASVRSILDILGVLALLVFLGLLTYRAMFVVWESLSNNAHSVTPLQAPLALPQGLWFVGLAGAACALVTVLLLALASLARGDRLAAAMLIGDQTIPDLISPTKNDP